MLFKDSDCNMVFKNIWRLKPPPQPISSCSLPQRSFSFSLFCYYGSATCFKGTSQKRKSHNSFKIRGEKTLMNWSGCLVEFCWQKIHSQGVNRAQEISGIILWGVKILVVRTNLPSVETFKLYHNSEENHESLLMWRDRWSDTEVLQLE